MTDNTNFNSENKNASSTNGKKISTMMVNKILAALHDMDPTLYPSEIYIEYKISHELSQLKSTDKEGKEALKAGTRATLVNAKDENGKPIESGVDSEGNPIYQKEEKFKNKTSPITVKTDTNFFLTMLYAAYIEEIESFYQESDDFATIQEKIKNNVVQNNLVGISGLVFDINDKCDTKIENEFHQTNYDNMMTLFKSAGISSIAHGNEIINCFLGFLDRLALNIANKLVISSKRMSTKKDADPNDEVLYNSAATRFSLTPNELLEHILMFNSCFDSPITPDIGEVFEIFREERTKYEKDIKEKKREEKERKRAEKANQPTLVNKSKISSNTLSEALTCSTTPEVQDPANEKVEISEPEPKPTRRRQVGRVRNRR
jgi:hypothetical protein